MHNAYQCIYHIYSQNLRVNYATAVTHAQRISICYICTQRGKKKKKWAVRDRRHSAVVPHHIEREFTLSFSRPRFYAHQGISLLLGSRESIRRDIALTHKYTRRYILHTSQVYERRPLSCSFHRSSACFSAGYFLLPFLRDVVAAPM